MSKQKKQINSKTKTTMGILGIILGISLLVFNYVDKCYDLDEYYEAFIFNNDNIMVDREIRRV